MLISQLGGSWGFAFSSYFLAHKYPMSGLMFSSCIPSLRGQPLEAPGVGKHSSSTSCLVGHTGSPSIPTVGVKTQALKLLGRLPIPLPTFPGTAPLALNPLIFTFLSFLAPGGFISLSFPRLHCAFRNILLYVIWQYQAFVEKGYFLPPFSQNWDFVIRFNNTFPAVLTSTTIFLYVSYLWHAIFYIDTIVNLKNKAASYFISKMGLFKDGRELQLGTSKLRKNHRQVQIMKKGLFL